MNKLSTAERAQVVAALVEGNSINATVRMKGISKPTILKLLLELGEACEKYQREKLVNLRSKRIQCDEIWSFVYGKDKNLPKKFQGKSGMGSVWTWTALDADSKLIVSWLVGERDATYANAFMNDIAGRLSRREQLTTDGHRAYLEAVEEAFGCEIDYAMLVKLYGESAESEKRYSSSECIGCKKTDITGSPDPEHVSTSYVERQNLTMRMSMRRFTRLTNAFSKKIQNHEASISLYFMYYNFARVHMTLRVTPAMEAGISNHIWTIEEIVGLLN